MAVPAPSRRCPPAMRMPLQHMLPMLPDGLQATGHLPATRSKARHSFAITIKRSIFAKNKQMPPAQVFILSARREERGKGRTIYAYGNTSFMV